MTNPPEPTQQGWVDASMEQGFTLPQAAFRKSDWLYAGVFVIMYFSMPEKDRSAVLICAGYVTLIFFALSWYARRDKLVYLSSAGIRGRSTFRWGWQRITWAEPLTISSFDVKGGKFYTFTSSVTGKDIDLPAIMLQSTEFLSAIAIYAPPNHPFRELKPDSWDW
jgi:hypothetical protein